MAKVCEICGRRVQVGNRVSHANNRTKRRFLPNIQKVRVITASGRVRKINVCVRCLKSGKVQKYLKVKSEV